MTYPMQHKIDMRHKYTPSDKTDIRITFERIRNAANSNQPVLDADPVPAGAAKRSESDRCGW